MKHPAAFIIAIADEGTKDEAIRQLANTWDELVDARAERDALLALLADIHAALVTNRSTGEISKAMRVRIVAKLREGKMSDDLVTRLRVAQLDHNAWRWGWLAEITDEIERLRALLAEARGRPFNEMAWLGWLMRVDAALKEGK